MSAYSASHPVTASTTEPSATKPVQGDAAKNCTAYSGLAAARICGAFKIATTPITVKAANHTKMMGPKKRPILWLPWLCTANSATRIAMVSGSTRCLSAALSTAMPSTADSTEMAGVSMPSP